MQIGDYTATIDSFPQSVYEELKADKHVYRHYRSPDGQVIDLYIGYYGTAKGGRTGHNPYACLPSSGWVILQDNNIKLDPGYKEEMVEVNSILTKKNNIYNVVLHWYQSAGTKVIGSGLEQNIHRFISSVLYNRNDGAFVRVSMHVPKEHIQQARTKVRSFAEQILSLLPNHWPVEKEIRTE